MNSLLRTAILVLFLAAPQLGQANSDGQVAWTSVSFCNGSGVCISMSSDNGAGLTDLSITHHGKPVGNLPEPGDLIAHPLFHETRLISAGRADGGYENRLELAFLDASLAKYLYKVTFYQGSVYKVETVAVEVEPI